MNQYRIIKKDFECMESLYYPQYKCFLIWKYFKEKGDIKRFHYLNEATFFIREKLYKDEEKKPIKQTVITKI